MAQRICRQINDQHKSVVFISQEKRGSVRIPTQRPQSMLGSFPFYATLSLLLIVFAQNVSAHNISHANYPGDLYLASFFPVHVRLPQHKQGVCGAIQHEDGIQLLEMLFYSLDLINKDKKLNLPFKLGSKALDSCDDDSHALDQAIKFIKLSITMAVETRDAPYTCKDGSKPELNRGMADWTRVIGVVGGASSTVSIALASLLRLVSTPQVSYMATSPDLSNKVRYSYFKRTVPSDTGQAKAIIETLKTFNWTYVSVVYENSNYGLKAFTEFEQLLGGENICFSVKEAIDFNEDTWNENSYDDIIYKLQTKYSRVKVVVLFAAHPQARNLFKAAKRMGLSNDVIWIGSDGWSGRLASLANVEEIVNNSITVQPLSMVNQIEGFEDYFVNLDPRANTRNPWFKEFWEYHFKCTLAEGPKKCSGREKLSKGYVQQPHLHYVYDAAYAFAYALKNMHAEVCRDTASLCKVMEPPYFSGERLLKHLAGVNFTSLTGDEFKFLNGSDGPPRYTLLNFVNISGSSEWKTIGQYSGIAGEGGLNFTEDFKKQMGNFPASFCSSECGPGQIKKFLHGNQCCWICVDCDEYQYVVKTGKEERCVDCQNGLRPNTTRNGCVTIPVSYITHASPWALVAMGIASLGCICTLFVLFVFARFNNTPVIKASGRELSLLLLVGILFSYMSTFLFVSEPSDIMCGLVRFFLGFCYTFIYAAILTKTNRICRIFADGGTSPQRARYTSPGSQMIIVCFLTMPQIIILFAWIASDLPMTTHVYPKREQNVLVCAGAEKWSYLIELAYPFVLILFCSVYAFRTRKTPDGFNETRLIGFTSYTTLVIWLAFVPIYFTTSNYNLKALTLSIAMSLNATIVLGCLFAPKVHICLFRPEKNTRDAVMTKSGSNITGSARPASTPMKPTPPIERTGTIRETRASTMPTRARPNSEIPSNPAGPQDDLNQTHSAPTSPTLKTPPTAKRPNRSNNKEINCNDVCIKLEHLNNGKTNNYQIPRRRDSMSMIKDFH